MHAGGDLLAAKRLVAPRVNCTGRVWYLLCESGFHGIGSLEKQHRGHSITFCLEEGLSENDAREAAQAERDRLATRHDFPDLCSRCCKKLTVPFVLWEPALDTPYIGFHVECTADLIMELERNYE